ncbi:MAG: TIGR01212 family radical SAM protein [endosymbiont of Galathealinum brachiosum]|uniref:TIGR01212 family radical SAM protein n=1 Tax=endosymbiont of Galathealinum brachiosum TaxID=2200906 RepID=A0A370DFW9_9GAMM|nr:MAG: TIGR01212 family radical SAM protein [endosymbiont of Galathealinum brachiosum]
MQLSDYVNTFGQNLLQKYGERVHKISLNANLTCPNRDGTKGIGGCTFCNNVSFNPNARDPDSITSQIASGRKVIRKRTGAKKYLAYFQAYTNTYGDINQLKQLYDLALSEDDVIGLSIGTRPDCVPDEVLDLLAEYQNRGYEIWLELGLQSSFDETLKKVNRGHGFYEYYQAIHSAHKRGIKVCTHLILGLPGENYQHFEKSLSRVIDEGVAGLKLHPLHVVKGTQLAREWLRKEYIPLSQDDYVMAAAKLIEMTPREIIYHRVTGTASNNILLAPEWCSKKWNVINSITQQLHNLKVNKTTLTNNKQTIQYA